MRPIFLTNKADESNFKAHTAHKCRLLVEQLADIHPGCMPYIVLLSSRLYLSFF